MPSAAQSPLPRRDTRALDDALLARFEDAGFVRLDPPILQPADVFLDLSGESIRRRLYLTTDAEGAELCLRPDLTIPVAREVLATGRALPTTVSYLGSVFRFRGEGTGEFRQAGIESFGRPDIAAADAEILALGLETCAIYNLPSPEIRLGDVGLFAALLDALPLPPAWRRRLLKDFGQGRLDADLSRLSPTSTGDSARHAGVLNALAGSDPEGARALIADLLSIAGITTVGGRTVPEIAARFLEQAALDAGNSLPAETSVLLSRYLAIAGDPDTVSGQLRDLTRDAGLDLGAALDVFDRRTGFLTTQGIVLSDVLFSTAFGRPLDYYSGMVFELHDPQGRVSGPLVAGGRYDPLMSRLGAAQPIPAVGLAAWLERLAVVESA
ncbi:ATP phosphoribosyltransferase regulatory subunit [Aquabacter spiritensis]|uniref:ATP phosphoribosyltransferase regulatory subunit n=1 Tax=Aquabacter spiritensis TaxID=933073 RepID=A0A4R3M7J8_9HYPH|nr:ATP phosphoribosyltransferase regulatory subunit [Aquabacter spiritensis]TCT07587.1 ATP phosphoribosyltransferase regulatory subunit [Aquabacter spiritensis]